MERAEISEHQKANPTAATGELPVIFPEGTTFIDGRPLTGDGGGMVHHDGTYYSVAAPALAPGHEPISQTPDGKVAVPYNRTGRATFLNGTASKETTMGAELEWIRLDEEGYYADLSHEELMQIAELFSFMGESGTPVTSDPDELERFYWNMVHEGVDAAARAKQYMAAPAVFGQPVRADQINPHPYVRHVSGEMAARTGFDTVQMFRAAGAQAHTGITNTMAGVLASEAMQYLSPLLMAPTMAGPAVRGGIAGNLNAAEFTPQQQAHMERMGVRRDDLSDPYQSYRHLLRLLGSPSAGPWQTSPPSTVEGYVIGANDKLRRGKINTLDRFNGWHSDRARIVFDNKSGVNTNENCAPDTALANVRVLSPLHVANSAIFSALERMAKRGNDPREKVADTLGISGLNPEERLQVVGRIALKVARYGNDAKTYKGKTPGQWLRGSDGMFKLAEEAPHLQINADRQQRLQRAYATQEESWAEIEAWRTRNGNGPVTPHAYFDLNLGTPATYMNMHLNHLLETHTPEQAVRLMELATGMALHEASYRQRESVRG